MIEQLAGQLSTWLSSITGFLPVGYAFVAGMVSTVNPCGFAILPAYLGLYLGSADAVAARPRYPSARTLAQVSRAMQVSLAVTAGFVLLFGGVGVLVSAGGQLIVALAPWAALGTGVLLIALGLALLLGRRLPADFAARLAARVGDPRAVSPRGFFLFGIVFALSSLSCTLPIFLTVVGSSLVVRGLLAGVLQFVLYALGMGLVVLVLTVGTALLKGAAIIGLRKATPYAGRVSALLMMVAGAYIVYYWLFKGGLVRTLV